MTEDQLKRGVLLTDRKDRIENLLTVENAYPAVFITACLKSDSKVISDEVKAEIDERFRRILVAELAKIDEEFSKL